MIDFNIGDVLIGKVNNCKIKVLEIFTDKIANIQMVKYIDLSNFKTGYATLQRLQHSHFEVIKGATSNDTMR